MESQNQGNNHDPQRQGLFVKEYLIHPVKALRHILKKYQQRTSADDPNSNSSTPCTTTSQVKAVVANTPHMTINQAQILVDLILTYKVEQILELGTGFGVSACYMASALEHQNRGHVTSIDRVSTLTQSPTATELLKQCGLDHRVTCFYEPRCYTWRLYKMLEAKQRETFDLCFIDAGHDWLHTGYGFFLVDKLLKPGGWIIFDDLGWSYNNSPSLKSSPEVLSMPTDEATTPQVQKVFDLLVREHPNYGSFKTQNNWGYARKARARPQTF